MEGEASTRWTEALAAALVTRSALPPAAARGLARGLHIGAAPDGVGELHIVMANGATGAGARPEDLALYRFVVASRGAVSTEPLAAAATLASAQPSAARAAIAARAPVAVTRATPGHEALAEWRAVAAAAGWLLAVPLSCAAADEAGGPARCDHRHVRLLGAVVLAGAGAEPPPAARAAGEFACDLAAQIRHTSIAVMETSLDVLRVLFPPRTIAALLASAASGRAPLTHAGIAAASAESPAGPGSAEASPPSPMASAAAGVRGALVLAPAARAASAASLTAASPFAALAGLGPASVTGSSAGRSTRPSGDSAASPPGMVTPEAAAALLREASSLGLAGARDPASLLEDRGSLGSPRASEVEGFEDILSESHASSELRRPSVDCAVPAPLPPAPPGRAEAGPAPEPTLAPPVQTARSKSLPAALSTIQEGAPSEGAATASTVHSGAGVLLGGTNGGIWQQRADLTFKDGRVEAAFERWLQPGRARRDRGAALVFAACLLACAATCAARGAACGAPLQRTVVALALAPLAAAAAPRWWARHRTVLLLVLRGAAAAALAAPRPAAQAAFEAAASMACPMPFAAHLPLSLCISWVAVAAASLQGPGAAAPLPRPAVLALQAAVALALPAAAVRVLEQRQRAAFRRAAGGTFDCPPRSSS